MKRKFILFIGLMVVSNFLFAQIHMVSGLKGGTYSQFANDISRVVKTELELQNSEGSLENMELIKNDENVHLAFMQYDVLLTQEKMNSGVKEYIQIFLPLFLDEEVHVLTLKESGIKKLKHLEGKEVAVGSPEQGTFVTAKTIKNHTGINWEEVEMNSNEAFKALAEGQVDAMFYVGGIPVSSIQALPDDLRERLRFVKVRHPKLKDIYKKKTYKDGGYTWYDDKIKTIATPTLLVVNTRHLDDAKEKELQELYRDVKSSIKELQETGHEKWMDVYYKNQNIRWPYYYVPDKEK